MIYTIHIAIPPSTDIGDLIGTYGDLLSAMMIPNSLGHGSGHFSHPIEESRLALLEQFHLHHSQLSLMKNDYPELKVVGQVIGQNMATLTLSTT